MYKLIYQSLHLCEPRIWFNLDRENVIRQAMEVIDAFRNEGFITIWPSANDRCFIRYFLGETDFEICSRPTRFSYAALGLYYKTITGALDALDIIAESKLCRK